MHLIETYLHVVISHLPLELRDDVKKELQSNIEDMLPSNPSEEDIYKVLEELGDPVILASEYSQKKRYLIGPLFYDQYISMLKLLLSFIPAIIGVIVLVVGLLTQSAGDSVIDVFVDAISSAVDVAIQVVLWVTFGFIIAERTGVNEGKLPFVKKKWTPNDLIKVEIAAKKIPLGEIIGSMVFTIVFVTVINLNQKLIGWYSVEANGGVVKHIEPLFVANRLQVYMYIIIALAVFSLLVNLWKFIVRQWNLSLAICNAGFNTAISILFIIMVSDRKLFNPVFINKINNTIGQDVEIWSKGTIIIVSIVFVAISTIDSIFTFRKVRKSC